MGGREGKSACGGPAARAVLERAFAPSLRLRLDGGTTMQALGFSHFTIRSTRFDEAVRFYRDVVGLNLADRPLPPGFPRAAIASFPDGAWCVHLFEATPEERQAFAALPEARTGVLKHVSLKATGYLELRARLEARGMTFREFTLGERHLVQFFDLDGVEIEATFSPAELPNGPVAWSPP